MARKESSFGELLAAVGVGLLAVAAGAAQAAAQEHAERNPQYAKPEKVEEAARNIVEAFKERARRDEWQLKYSRFEALNLEGEEYVEAMETVVKGAIYDIATYDVRRLHTTSTGSYVLDLSGVDYDADTSDIANNLDWENITKKDLAKVYLVWLGLRGAKEAYKRQEKLSLF